MTRVKSEPERLDDRSGGRRKQSKPIRVYTMDDDEPTNNNQTLSDNQTVPDQTVNNNQADIRHFVNNNQPVNKDIEMQEEENSSGEMADDKTGEW